MPVKINVASIKKLDKQLGKKEKLFTPKLEKRYDSFGVAAKKQVKTFKSGTRKNIKLSPAINRKVQANLKKTLDGYFSDIEKLSINSVKKELSKHAKTKDEFLNVANIQTSKSVKGNKRWAGKLAEKQTKDYEKYINKALKDAVKVNPDISEKALKNLIDQKTKTFKNVRLDNTVLNESNRIQNQVRIEAYRESNLVKSVMFVAVLDTRTTQNCQDKNGTVLDLNSSDLKFFIIPNHPKCRSYLVYILKTDTRIKNDSKAEINRLILRFGKPKTVTNQPKYYEYEAA